MECLDAEAVLAFIEGRIDDTAVAALEAHATGCAACMDLLATAAGLGARAGSSPADSVTQVLSPGATRRAGTRESPLARGASVGRYLLLELVGKGGMGEVYAAYDPELDRRVAVKLLRAERSDDSAREASSRLLREAKAIARLSHPNVVVVYDAGSWLDRVFLAIEYVEGETLKSWLAARPRSWRQVRDAFVGAGRGLAAAHAAGLVHRDFKPQNVMVGRDGNPRVTDFGLVREVHSGSGESDRAESTEPGTADDGGTLGASLTRTGVLVGTPTYMAPEQFRAEPADERSDQFSYCVALYEGLYGERPFAGDSIRVLREAVQAGHVRDPPDKSAVPGWLRRVVLRGLRREREERYESMKDLLLALERDPGRQARRALAVGALVIALMGVGIGFGKVAGRAEGLCHAAGDKLAGVWEGPSSSRPTPRRSAVRRAFLAINHSWATDTWERASRALDRYGARWAAAYTDACEATHARGEQSAEVLDLRMGGLHERLGQLKALTDIFASADGPVVLGAVDAVNALGGLERCTDVALLRTVVAAPRDERTRAAVEALRPRVAVLKALGDSGHHEEALRDGGALVRDTKATGYKPLLAEALYALGWVLSQTGDFRRSEVNLTEALWAAEEGRHDEVRANAAALLAGVVGHDLSRHNEAEHWARMAEALVERIGPGHDRIVAWIVNDRGNIRHHMGDFAGALELNERAVRLKEKVLGRDHPDVGLSLNNVDAASSALGDYARALAANDRALVIFRGAYGDQHPLVAQCLSNRGETLNALGRYDEARAAFQGALARWENAYGAEGRDLGYALTGLGNTDLATDRPRAASAILQRALAIRERQETDLIQIAETRALLGRALWQSAGDRLRARALMQAARDVYAKEPAFAPQLLEADEWLEAHRPSRTAALFPPAASTAAKK